MFLSIVPTPTFDHVEFDFEEYVSKHGIPETRDPLPFKKQKSLFGNHDLEKESLFTSAKHDPRLRTVVCRHWLRGLCMKGSSCEFLHQYDLSKMPVCHRGDQCQQKDCCPFQHPSKRPECTFYNQGFCVRGAHCRHAHIKKDRQDLPIVADFTQQTTVASANKIMLQPHHSTNSRTPTGTNGLYKTSLCKHFMRGSCPYGATCHFAHGESELRKFVNRPSSQGAHQVPGKQIPKKRPRADTFSSRASLQYFKTFEQRPK
ncbi:expressed unknown protein [Seminavis robusta]|uniref:C3H1-type domain-containing protein n=1 Tax=Seminavis robusta TaxID=568900 RepID=A0A9N8DMH3_9STRA|nr:expressed unknown protein [Seminavis robusta]|eukprot:Sro137_g064362.1  (259) ;mRNA; r:56526-57302